MEASVTNGKGSQAIEIKAKSNDTEKEREGKISVRTKGADGVIAEVTTVKVIQSAFPIGDVLTGWTLAYDAATAAAFVSDTLKLPYDAATLKIMTANDSSKVVVSVIKPVFEDGKLKEWTADDLWGLPDADHSDWKYPYPAHTIEFGVKDKLYTGKEDHFSFLILKDKDDKVVSRIPIFLPQHPGLLEIPAALDTVYVDKDGNFIKPALDGGKLNLKAISFGEDAEWAPTVDQTWVKLAEYDADAEDGEGNPLTGIKPGKGAGPLTISKVEKNETGANRDAVITVTIQAKFMTDHPDFLSPAVQTVRVIQLGNI